LIILIGALSCSPALAADGKAVFESNGCTACHAADKEMVGPSLQEIASKYAANRDALVAFLGGSAAPKVDPDEFAIMKPNLTKTQALADADRAALADFILSHK
jgi:cytochrome c